MLYKSVMSEKSDRQQLTDTEALILQAAEREFMDKGFAGARTTSIASAAGVTHAMLHYYFRTKEKLFERIITEKISLLRDALVESVSDMKLPLEEVIRNVIDRHLDFIAANPDLPRFLVGEIFSNPERSAILLGRLREYSPAVVAFFQGKIDSAAAQGKCRPGVDARMLLLDLVSLNVFPFMAAPMVNAAMGYYEVGSPEFLAMKKRENFDTVMRKLNPIIP